MVRVGISVEGPTEERFIEIGLPVLRDKCTGFGAWLDTLEALQK